MLSPPASCYLKKIIDFYYFFGLKKLNLKIFNQQKKLTHNVAFLESLKFGTDCLKKKVRSIEKGGWCSLGGQAEIRIFKNFTESYQKKRDFLIEKLIFDSKIV